MPWRRQLVGAHSTKSVGKSPAPRTAGVPTGRSEAGVGPEVSKGHAAQPVPAALAPMPRADARDVVVLVGPMQGKNVGPQEASPTR